MTVTFAADGSSFQGLIDWRETKAAGYGAGTEKVTQGLGYLNPYWPANRAALLAAAGPDFVPGAYHYLTAGDGAGQADFFAASAGPIPGFVIWCDLERATAGAQPTVADAHAFVSRLRMHYPAKRIGVYAGESFTGTASLRFADMLWSPHYVEGTGSPAELYKEVPASWWAPYGGLVPTLLQFSASAPVPGVKGLADISAYRGTAAQMHAALLGTRKPLHRKDPPMLMKHGAGAVTPLALSEGEGQIVLVAEDTATVIVQIHNHGDNEYNLTWQPEGARIVDIPAGVQALRLHRVDAGAGDVAVTAQ